MRNIALIFILSILSLSCTSRTIYKKPKDLIDKEKMISLWTDLYIASGAKTVKTITLKSKINYIPLVLKKYNIDSVQFSNSNIYYTSRIDEYQKMFMEVQNRIETLREVYQPESTDKKDTISTNLKEQMDTIKKKKLRRKLLQKKVRS